MLYSLRRLARSVLDVVTHRWGLPRTINGRTWRLSAKCWRAFPSVWEEELDALLESVIQPGMVVADVGAHVGMHTLNMAQRVGDDGHVFAFEPVPEVAKLLAHHLRLNRLERRVTLVQQAVGDCEGRAEMQVDPRDPDPGNSFVSRSYAPRLQSLTVEMTTLAAFFSCQDRRPSFIKIDVEGYELRVLKGAGAILEGADVPTLACAIHPWHLRQLGESEESFFVATKELGLEVLNLQGLPTVPNGAYREVMLKPRRQR